VTESAPPSPAGVAVEIRGVSKTFRATRAVRDLDLVVPMGEVTGFLGPNGAGKSTTIRMIMSIIRPDTGSIDVLGGTALERKDRIGYLPEERGVYRKMKVAEFLRYVAVLKDVPRAGLDRRIRDWLARVELPDVAKRRCEELSKGMQQKVQFLAAIIHDPDLVILDEPFSGLDPVNAELLYRLIRELHEAGKTIIFSTHVLFQAERICDRVFLINRGRKLLDDDLATVKARFEPRTIEAEPEDAGDVHGLADACRGLDGVEAAEADEETGRVFLHPTDGTDPTELMRRVLAAHRLRAVERSRISLEEIFVRLVSRDLGAEAAAEVREELAAP